MADNTRNDSETPKIKIIFTEGCFDDFDGTQEELDELVAQITAMAESGELLENAVEINLEDLEDEVKDLLPMITSGNTRH